jgi:hypothetical protein
MKALKPVPGQFVVRASNPPDLQTLARRLSAATVEPLAGDPRALVVRFDGPGPADQTALARAIRKAAGAGATVLPVMEDANGRAAFPTGRVGVRFKQRVEDESLRAFGRRHGLTLVRRNEFQPEQAMFEPKDLAARSLAEAVDEAAADDDVRLAWPETESAYDRY